MIWLNKLKAKLGVPWFKDFEKKFLTQNAHLIDEKFHVMNYIKDGGSSYNITLEGVQQYLNGQLLESNLRYDPEFLHKLSKFVLNLRELSNLELIPKTPKIQSQQQQPS